MLPQGLFGISPFLLVIPFVGWLSFYVFLLGVRRAGLPVGRVMLLQAIAAVAGLLGARAFSLVFEWGWNPLAPEPGLLGGGWRYPGGILMVTLVLLVLKPRLLPEVSLARYGDLVAPAAALAMAVIRLHCFMMGCCVGAVCHGAFCFSYRPGSEVWRRQLEEGLIAGADLSHPVLPLHLLFMASSLSVAAFLFWFDSRRRYDGQVALLFFLLHDGSKFLLELLRDPPSPLLQLAGFLPAALALGVLVVASRANRPARALGR